jgi:phenylacetate-CoA ligase
MMPDAMAVLELSVIVPCFNEAANLPELVRRIGQTFVVGGLLPSLSPKDSPAPPSSADPVDAEGGESRAELILVDDGSTDDSVARMAELAARYPFVRPLRHERNQGIAAAWRTGAQAARGLLCCIIDADLQYQPEDILRLRRELAWSNCDIVQGYRSMVGRERDSRYYYSRGLNTMLNGLFGMRLIDNKSGFLMCAREVFLDLLDYRGDYAYFQTFVMVAAHAKGYTYKEVETLFERRKAGVSFLENQPVKPIARTLLDLGRGFLEYRLGPRRTSDLKRFASAAATTARDQAPAGDGVERSPLQRRHLDAYLSTFGLTHWMMTRDVATHVADLGRTQWLSPAAVRDMQEEKLRRLVHHAYHHVPYYRARMQALGLLPGAIRSLDDLPKLPFLTKDDIRQHLSFDILSDNHQKSEILRITTSGSTGEPFVCYVDRVQLEFRWAATLRSQEWTGYRFGDRTMRLWHQTLGMSKSQILRERADAMASRRRFIPAFEMNERNLADLCAQIAEYRPTLIDGYAESFNLIAAFLAHRGGEPLSGLPKGVLKGIISSAQSLPDESRRTIEEAFGCRVFDKYGSREFSGIAYECDAHQGHHIVAEGYIVEVLKDGRPAQPGEVGEIVITDLNNHCLPFIRYRIGDLGEAMDPSVVCACGRGLPRIGRIEGRVQSIILGADGQYLPSAFFMHLLKDYPHAFRHYQFVQESRESITWKIVKGERYTDEALREVLTILQRYLGAGMRIDVEFVDNIPMVRTGKRLAVVSKLKLDFQKLR